MAELVARDTSGGTTSEVIAPSTITPVQELAQTSTTSYTRPPETQPSLTTQEAIVYSRPTTTNTAQPKPSTTATTTTEPIAQTRPLLVNNLLIDPVAGTTTALTSTGLPAMGGGFGGASAPEDTSGKAATKKSWIPLILIAIGIVVLMKKTKKAA